MTDTSIDVILDRLEHWRKLLKSNSPIYPRVTYLSVIEELELVKKEILEDYNHTGSVDMNGKVWRVGDRGRYENGAKDLWTFTVIHSAGEYSVKFDHGTISNLSPISKDSVHILEGK